MKKEKREKDFLHKPVYPGGMKAMREFLKQHLRYPKQARQEGLEGTVSLKYTINHLGKVVAVKVVSGLGSGCDEEAIRLVKMLKFEVPKNRKMKVLFHKSLQIHFRLPKENTAKPPAEHSAGIRYEYTSSKPKTEKPTDPPSRGYSYTIEW
jgi:protein TonB